MRHVRGMSSVIAAIVSLGVAASPAFATSWELRLQFEPNVTGMQIRVCQTLTGTIIGTYSSNTLQALNDFTVDFNGTPGADVQLAKDVQYTVTFIGWGKSCYIKGSIPDSVPNYDDTYSMTANSNVITHVSGNGVQRAWDLGEATCATPPPPPPPGPGLLLWVDQRIPIADKTTYKLKASASGGSGGYTFSWSNATMTTGATTNPSLATRTCLNSQTVTVTCTVTSGNGTTTKSIVIGGGGGPP